MSTTVVFQITVPPTIIRGSSPDCAMSNALVIVAPLAGGTPLDVAV